MSLETKAHLAESISRIDDVLKANNAAVSLLVWKLVPQVVEGFCNRKADFRHCFWRIDGRTDGKPRARESDASAPRHSRNLHETIQREGLHQFAGPGKPYESN